MNTRMSLVALVLASTTANADLKMDYQSHLFGVAQSFKTESRVLSIDYDKDKQAIQVKAQVGDTQIHDTLSSATKPTKDSKLINVTALRKVYLDGNLILSGSVIFDDKGATTANYLSPSVPLGTSVLTNATLSVKSNPDQMHHVGTITIADMQQSTKNDTDFLLKNTKVDFDYTAGFGHELDIKTMWNIEKMSGLDHESSPPTPFTVNADAKHAITDAQIDVKLKPMGFATTVKLPKLHILSTVVDWQSSPLSLLADIDLSKGISAAFDVKSLTFLNKKVGKEATIKLNDIAAKLSMSDIRNPSVNVALNSNAGVINVMVPHKKVAIDVIGAETEFSYEFESKTFLPLLRSGRLRTISDIARLQQLMSSFSGFKTFFKFKKVDVVADSIFHGENLLFDTHLSNNLVDDFALVFALNADKFKLINQKNDTDFDHAHLKFSALFDRTRYNSTNISAEHKKNLLPRTQVMLNYLRALSSLKTVAFDINLQQLKSTNLVRHRAWNIGDLSLQSTADYAQLYGVGSGQYSLRDLSVITPEGPMVALTSATMPFSFYPYGEDMQMHIGLNYRGLIAKGESFGDLNANVTLQNIAKDGVSALTQSYHQMFSDMYAGISKSLTNDQAPVSDPFKNQFIRLAKAARKTVRHSPQLTGMALLNTKEGSVAYSLAGQFDGSKLPENDKDLMNMPKSDLENRLSLIANGTSTKSTLLALIKKGVRIDSPQLTTKDVDEEAMKAYQKILDEQAIVETITGNDITVIMNTIFKDNQWTINGQPAK